MGCVTVSLQRNQNAEDQYRVVITHVEGDSVHGYLLRDCSSFAEAHQVSQAAILKGEKAFHDESISNWPQTCNKGCCWASVIQHSIPVGKA